MSTRRRTRAQDSDPVSPPRQRRPTRFRAALVFLLAIAVAAGCGGGGPSRPTETPSSTAVPAGSDIPAARDLVDLAQRLRGIAAPPRSVQLPPLKVGDVQQFELVNLPANAAQRPDEQPISATVRAVSDHAYFFFQNGSMPESEVQAAVQSFEGTIWPKITALFGLPDIPGVDGDPRIVILHAALGGGVGGYVNGDDSYPKAVVRHSNQREMLYINDSVRPLGTAGYEHLVAHELQHLIHRAHGGDPETWISEGLSEYAGDYVAGPTAYQSFLNEPDTQLNAWEDGTNAHYGASALFIDYLPGQGATDIGKLAAEPGTGTDGVRKFLSDVGEKRSFEQVVADWAIANLLDQPAGPYSYPTRDVGPAATQRVSATGPVAADVHQFGTDYLELQATDFSGPVDVSFSADAQVPVIAGEAQANGAFWYSGRGDNIDATMTRELDLSKVKTATLTFRTWFDTERWFDWGYAEVSKDGGQTWQVLAGQHTSTDDPLGSSFGPGYTGRSGGGAQAAWVNERIDLTPYAGAKVLLRFELVNDDGTNLPGWAIDDIAVPEIGFRDGGDSTNGWERHGFRIVSQPLAQRFAVRLVTFGATTQVQDVTLDGQNAATLHLSGLGKDYDKAVIAIIGETDGTTELAHYRYDVEKGGP